MASSSSPALACPSFGLHGCFRVGLHRHICTIFAYNTFFASHPCLFELVYSVQPCGLLLCAPQCHITEQGIETIGGLTTIHHPRPLLDTHYHLLLLPVATTDTAVGRAVLAVDHRQRGGIDISLMAVVEEGMVTEVKMGGEAQIGTMNEETTTIAVEGQRGDEDTSRLQGKIEGCGQIGRIGTIGNEEVVPKTAIAEQKARLSSVETKAAKMA